MVISHSKAEPLTISLLLTILGIGLTVWLPTYARGIFLIRVFAKEINNMALTEYELQTKNYQISYISNYYYLAVGGLLS
ncbi:hypothetical protein [Ligilactobacillus apodemi]|uniref:hypothetical protein n=1 Tax=Ligilactobacillus apodemi TaxID=307126 RepID=UPI000A42335D|nr:hypothetical protein [Ligilactobacillus apodemi]